MLFSRKPTVRSRARAYPGRIVFDHQAKTGGQAINRWLMEQLGAGCVTPNLVIDHARAIRRYGGSHSVISGHLHFGSGDALDPRYDYVTLFREPVDRAVSWIYYLINEVGDRAENPELVTGARRFLDTDGRDATPAFLDSIRNQALAHFSATMPLQSADDAARLAAARRFLSGYTLLGVYDNLPEFTRGLADLIGLPRPQSLARTNGTRDRQRTGSVSPALRARIDALTALDRALYDWVAAGGQRTAQVRRGWEKYDGPRPLEIASEAARILTPGTTDLGRIARRAEIALNVTIALERIVPDLVVGLHIHDSDGQLAFGVNSAELEHSIGQCPPGQYDCTFTHLADLPFGNYRAGFAVVNRRPDGQFEHLAWRDGLIAFEVARPPSAADAPDGRLSSTRVQLNPRNVD